MVCRWYVVGCCQLVSQFLISHFFSAFASLVDQLQEEVAIAVYWVSDGIDRCRVGFLPRHFIKHRDQFDGQLAQVVRMYADSDNRYERQLSYRNKGMCVCTIISTVGYNAVDNNNNN